MTNKSVSIVFFPASSDVQGPVSQRVAINCTMDIHRSSMANCVQRAINRNPF